MNFCLLFKFYFRFMRSTFQYFPLFMRVYYVLNFWRNMFLELLLLFLFCFLACLLHEFLIINIVEGEVKSFGDLFLNLRTKVSQKYFKDRKIKNLKTQFKI